jgi:hypothetical protein
MAFIFLAVPYGFKISCYYLLAGLQYHSWQIFYVLYSELSHWFQYNQSNQSTYSHPTCDTSCHRLLTRRGVCIGNWIYWRLIALLVTISVWQIYTLYRLKLKLIYDRQSVGQSVLVSGTHLGPTTNFSFSLKFPLYSCGFVIL